jgi:hypothetical protein
VTDANICDGQASLVSVTDPTPADTHYHLDNVEIVVPRMCLGQRIYRVYAACCALSMRKIENVVHPRPSSVRRWNRRHVTGAAMPENPSRIRESNVIFD